MGLERGFRLDHYEIVEMIGKGGMGEVYSATDTRLPRAVAVKTSKLQFSERFAREAKVIASLNHPNICTLFDVGSNYLVMEMIEGPTLADRIKDGPLSLDEAVGIMLQVADALDYAHEKGVVHRDLKPGNIKIRPDGVVKVLDFGLAGGPGDPGGRSGELAHRHHGGNGSRRRARDRGVYGAGAGHGQTRGQARGRVGLRSGVLRDAHRLAHAQGGYGTGGHCVGSEGRAEFE